MPLQSNPTISWLITEDRRSKKLTVFHTVHNFHDCYLLSLVVISCPQCRCLSTLLLPVHIATLCPQCRWLSTQLLPVHSAAACPRCYCLSTLLLSVHSAADCPRSYCLSTVPLSVHAATACPHCYSLSTVPLPVHTVTAFSHQKPRSSSLSLRFHSTIITSRKSFLHVWYLLRTQPLPNETLTYTTQ